MKEEYIKIPNWLTGLLFGLFGSFIACVFVGGMLVQSLNDIKEDTGILPALSQTVATHDVRINRLEKDTDNNDKRITQIESRIQR